MPTVLDENGTLHSFPDDATPEEMNASISEHIASENKMGTLPRIKRAIGIARNDAEVFPGKVGQFALNSLIAAPNEISGAAHQVAENFSQEIPDNSVGKPSRLLLNLIKAVTGIGHGISNIPHDLGEYAEHLGMVSPEAKANPLRKLITSESQPYPGERYIDKLLGDREAGDALIQNLPMIVGIGKPLVGVISRNLTGSHKIADLAKSLNIPAKENKVMQAEKEYAAASDIHDQAIKEQEEKIAELHRQGINTIDPNKIIGQIKNANEELERLRLEKQGHEHLINNVGQVGNKPEQDLSAQQQADNARQARQHAEELFSNSQQNHEGVKAVDQKISDQLDQVTNKGAAHDMRQAKQILDKADISRKEANGIYKTIDENLEGVNIKPNNEQPIKDKFSQINSILSNPENISKEPPELQTLYKQINDLIAQKSIPAKDALTMFRSVRDYARDAATKAYQPGMNAADREMWMARMKHLQERAGELGDVLKEGLPKDISEDLAKANAIWRDKVAPLHWNPAFQEMKQHTRTGNDLINQIRGTEKGNVILQNIIKDNPEIAANAIGQRFHGSGREDVLNPDEHMQSYLNAHPQINDLVGLKRNASEMLTRAKSDVSDAKNNLSKRVIEEKSANTAAKQAQTDYDNALKAYGGDKKRFDEERLKFHHELTNVNSTIRKHEENISRLEKAQKFLESSYNTPNQTLESKNSAGNKLKANKQELRHAKAVLKTTKYRVPFLWKQAKRLGAVNWASKFFWYK